MKYWQETMILTNLGPVDTDAFSFENANILLRFHVQSTRKRWKRCIVFDENANFRKRSPEWKYLKTQQYRLRVDGSNSLKTQTFENDWSCDLSPRPLSFEKSKMKDIDRECTVVFNWYRAPILKAWLQMSLCVAFLWTKAAAHLGVVILEFISSIIFFCFVRLLFFRCTAFRGYARQQIKCAPPSPILERGWPW